VCVYLYKHISVCVYIYKHDRTRHPIMLVDGWVSVHRERKGVGWVGRETSVGYDGTNSE
jgi:hypothetical protein